jgi:hypothetical protein
MYTWRSFSSVGMLKIVLQVAVLAQCTTIYLSVTRLQLGITPEDYVVIGYEGWMEVRLAVLIDVCGSFTELITGDVCQPSSVHPQHGLVQMLDNAVPPQPGSEQEAHNGFDRHCRLECSLDCRLMLFHRSARESLCAVGRCRGSGKTSSTR